jgi:hypothetical protein
MEIKKLMNLIAQVAEKEGYDPQEILKFKSVITDDTNTSRYWCAEMISYLKGFPSSLIREKPVLEQLEYLKDWIKEHRDFTGNFP